MKKHNHIDYIFAFFIVLLLPLLLSAQTSSSTQATSSPATTTPAQNVHDAAEVEKQVRVHFADIPIMIEVARCESRFRQFADSGNVFKGGLNMKMVGIFQIYGDVHRTTALSLGFDIDTVQGNIGYARYLYSRERTNPWISSMPCWNTGTVNEDGGTTQSLTTNLIFGIVHPEVKTLQVILNHSGFVVADQGAGSPGNETTLFGGLTRTAVRRFQCSQGIVCSGDEYTTAYGVVGPRTRLALAAIPGPTSTPQPSDSTEAARIAAIKAKIEALKKEISSLELQLPR